MDVKDGGGGGGGGSVVPNEPAEPEIAVLQRSLRYRSVIDVLIGTALLLLCVFASFPSAFLGYTELSASTSGDEEVRGLSPTILACLAAFVLLWINSVYRAHQTFTIATAALDTDNTNRLTAAAAGTGQRGASANSRDGVAMTTTALRSGAAVGSSSVTGDNHRRLEFSALPSNLSNLPPLRPPQQLQHPPPHEYANANSRSYIEAAALPVADWDWFNVAVVEGFGLVLLQSFIFWPLFITFILHSLDVQFFVLLREKCKFHRSLAVPRPTTTSCLVCIQFN